MQTHSPSLPARLAVGVTALGLAALAALGTFAVCSNLVERALTAETGRIQAETHPGVGER